MQHVGGYSLDQCSLVHLHDISDTHAANGTDLVASLALEPRGARSTKALMSARNKYVVLLLGQTDDALFAVSQSIWHVKNFDLEL